MSRQQKRGRGRPAEFVGAKARHLVSLIRKNGLTGAQAAYEAEAKGNSVSMPTLGKLAAGAGVKLHRGRRAA